MYLQLKKGYEMKRYAAWGYDGTFRFKWMAKVWSYFYKPKTK